MIGVLVLAAFGAAVLLGMPWLADRVMSDGQDQAVTPDDCRQESAPKVCLGRNADPAGAAADWLPMTLPALRLPTSLWQPRICAGRAAFLQAVTTVRDPEGWPAASYTDGHRWPLQEGTA